MNELKYRIAAEVDLSAIRQNYLALRARAPELNVMTVVKANAYGLGVDRVARTLKDAGSAGFCVATMAEAKNVLPLGLPVQILGHVFEDELPDAVSNGVIMGITDWDQAQKISAEAVRQGKKAECHFKLDTGMGRLGILYYDAPELIRKIVSLPGLDCAGIYSHFPKAYSGEDSFAAEQERRFQHVLDSCAGNGITFRKIHMANSDALTRFDRVLHAPFNYARAGLCMYGPFDEFG